MPGRDRNLIETHMLSLMYNTHNYIHSHTPWVLAEGGWSGLKLGEERVEFVVLGRKLKGQHQDAFEESLSHMKTPFFLVEYSPPLVPPHAQGKTPCSHIL